MGTDCSLYVFPKNRFPREYTLGRLSYMLADNCDDIGLNYAPPIPAQELYQIVKELPKYESPNAETQATAEYWRGQCLRYLLQALRRFGNDLTAMIYDEDYDARFVTEKDLLDRLIRKRRFRELKAQRDKEKRDMEGAQIVKEWIKNRYKDQYISGPATWDAYQRERGLKP